VPKLKFIKIWKTKMAETVSSYGFAASKGPGMGVKIMFNKVAIHDRNIRSRRS
jgi:hypothetical protein